MAVEYTGSNVVWTDNYGGTKAVVNGFTLFISYVDSRERVDQSKPFRVLVCDRRLKAMFPDHASAKKAAIACAVRLFTEALAAME